MSTAALLRRVERIADSTAITERSTDPQAQLASESLGAFTGEVECPVLSADPGAGTGNAMLITNLSKYSKERFVSLSHITDTGLAVIACNVTVNTELRIILDMFERLIEF